MPDSSHGPGAGTTLTPDFSFNPFRTLRYGDYRLVWSSETLLRRQSAPRHDLPALRHDS